MPDLFRPYTLKGVTLRNRIASRGSGAVDVVLLGRPALANPHWPVWAARELGVKGEFELVPEDWGWWLGNIRWPGSPGSWPR